MSKINKPMSEAGEPHNKTQQISNEHILAFSSLLEETLNEIYIFDVETLSYILVNHGARQNLGYGLDELLKMTPVDIKPDHTQESFRKVINPLLTGEKKKINFNTIHQRNDGSTYPVEVHLQKMRFNDRPVFVAFILDLTERTENKLKLDEARLFLDSAPDATVIVDESGKIQVCNQQMSDLLGYSYNELHEMNVDDLLPVRFRHGHQAHRASFNNNPRVRAMGAGMELSAMTKDGREIPIEVSLSPIKTSDDGKLVAAAIRDISARKATENALRKSEAQLRLAKESAESATLAKSRFLAAASHDIRQPLQALRLYLAALARNLDQPKQLQLSEKMNLSLDTMGELLDSLLDISTLESGSFQVDKRNVSLYEVMGKLFAANELQAQEKGIQLEYDGSDYIIYTDPALLARIVDNFISNAIRYTDKGKISIKCQLCDDAVIINVIDTGVGIPEDELENIFNEFYQLNNAVRDRSKGLGLGLSIVRHISRLLDHPITAKSIVGKGSTFSIEVPLGKSVKIADESIQVINPPSIQTEEPTILIVDDDPAIVDAMQELISALDVTVVTAESGEEALKYISDGLTPNLVVSDYRMPGMTGIELAIKIRAALNNNLPVVIMTGDTSVAKINDVDLVNCTVLYKPVDMEHLASLINSIQIKR